MCFGHIGWKYEKGNTKEINRYSYSDSLGVFFLSRAGLVVTKDKRDLRKSGVE